jgi:hypothetical protein
MSLQAAAKLTSMLDGITDKGQGLELMEAHSTLAKDPASGGSRRTPSRVEPRLSSCQHKISESLALIDSFI